MQTATDWFEGKDTSGRATREFTVHADRLVTGALWLPDDPALDVPLVCLGHGASGDRYQAPITQLAGRLVTAGYACLSMDGPVHGRRQVGDGGRGAFFPAYKRASSIDDMVADWQVAIDVVRGASDVITRDSRLGYFGLSMGAMFGIPLVGARQDFDVAVLGLVGVTGNFPHGDRILASAAEIQCPVLFLMQLEDELFDRTGCLKVFDALGTKDKRLHANPGLHPEVPAEEVDGSFEFLTRVLRGTHKTNVVNPLSE